MAPSRFDATSVVLENNNYYFNASGSVLKFDGYLRLYSPYEKQKDEILPELIEQEILESQNIEKTQHFTKPPARYSEAKLIKEYNLNSSALKYSLTDSGVRIELVGRIPS